MRSAWKGTVACGCAAVGMAAAFGEVPLLALRAIGLIYFLAAVAVRLRRDPNIARGPWQWILTGGSLVVLSVIVRLVHGEISGVANPFPSPADIPAMLGYACFVFAARSFWNHRSAKSDLAAALDGFLVAAATAVVIFSAILSDYIRDSTIDAGARAGNVGYAILDLILIGHVCRLAVGPGVRNQAWRLLAIASGLILINDLLFLLDTTGSTWALAWARIASPLAFFFIAAAILHPEASELTARPSYAPPRLTLGRLSMLAVALLTLPAALLAALVRDTAPDLSILVSGSTVLALASLARLSLLFRSQERIADFEAALGESGRALIDAHTVDEVGDAAAAALETVVSRSVRYVALIGDSQVGRRLVSRLDANEPATTTTLGRADETEIDTRSPLERAGAPHIVDLELGDRGGFGRISVDVAGPLELTHGLALQTMSAQITQAMASLRLAESRFARRAEQRLKALVEQSADLVTVIGEDDLVAYCSPNAQSVLGVDAELVVGADPLEVVHPEDVAAIAGLIGRPTKATEAPIAVEARVRVSSGDYQWFAVTTRDFSDDPEVGGTVLTARDVSEERAAKIGLKRSEQWFRGLVQHSSDVIAVLDDAGVFTYASPAANEITGLRPERLRGRNFMELLPSDDIDGLDRVRRAIRSRPAGGGNLELTIERPDGSRRTAEATITDLRDDPSVRGLVLNLRDVTDRKRLEDDLRHQALHDDLTGLSSRVQFGNQLAEALGTRHRPGAGVAALFIDVDDFKNINDSLGHAAGDQVLVELSGRLQSHLRLHDNAARIGGDEFAVLLTGVYGESDVTLVADRIVEELSQPVTLHGQEVQLSVSVGVAIDQNNAATPEDLLRSADVAMYEAKEQGKRRWAMFEASMADQTVERFELANSLGQAIENEELMVYFQPIVDLRNGRTVGVEALVRWNHPVRGMVSPASFIPLAERNGLIVPLGRYVLERSVEQVAAWRRDGHDIYASVNVSAVQLQRKGIVSEILEIVDRANMDRSAVVLELTESALVNDFDLVMQRIAALREAGLRVAIDDFGTGYATLTYADQFAADILKIDQSFVAKLEDAEESTIVSTVLTIAESMGAQTVAEGIEVPNQHRRLLALGCTLGQGYYFTRPAPAQAITEALTEELEGKALTGHGH